MSFPSLSAPGDDIRRAPSPRQPYGLPLSQQQAKESKEEKKERELEKKREREKNPNNNKGLKGERKEGEVLSINSPSKKDLSCRRKFSESPVDSPESVCMGTKVKRS